MQDLVCPHKKSDRTRCPFDGTTPLYVPNHSLFVGHFWPKLNAFSLAWPKLNAFSLEHILDTLQTRPDLKFCY